LEYQTPKPYLDDSCVRCGTCLSRCPVLGLTESEARVEIENLKEGRDRRVLKGCPSCMVCDIIFPNRCNTGEIIVKR